MQVGLSHYRMGFLQVGLADDGMGFLAVPLGMGFLAVSLGMGFLAVPLGMGFLQAGLVGLAVAIDKAEAVQRTRVSLHQHPFH